jgi:hypothetical protein
MCELSEPLGIGEPPYPEAPTREGSRIYIIWYPEARTINLIGIMVSVRIEETRREKENYRKKQENRSEHRLYRVNERVYG